MSTPYAHTKVPIRPSQANHRLRDEEVAVAAAEAQWEVVEDMPVMANDDLEDVDDDNAEVGEYQVGKDPKLPSEAEVEEHRAAGHWPFREWCTHCQLARGLCAPHRASDRTHEISVLSMDYFFLTMGKVLIPGEEGVSRLELEAQVENGDAIKCLALRDSNSKALFAWVIPRKGMDEFVVSRVVAAVEWLGYSRIMIKSDNEPAIRGLVRESLKAIKVHCEKRSPSTVRHMTLSLMEE